NSAVESCRIRTVGVTQSVPHPFDVVAVLRVYVRFDHYVVRARHTAAAAYAARSEWIGVSTPSERRNSIGIGGRRCPGFNLIARRKACVVYVAHHLVQTKSRFLKRIQ